MADSVSVRLKTRVSNKMRLNIRVQWNAGTACVSECVLKTLACRGLRVGPSKFTMLVVKGLAKFWAKNGMPRFCRSNSHRSRLAGETRKRQRHTGLQDNVNVGVPKSVSPAVAVSTPGRFANRVVLFSLPFCPSVGFVSFSSSHFFGIIRMCRPLVSCPFLLIH